MINVSVHLRSRSNLKWTHTLIITRVEHPEADPPTGCRPGHLPRRWVGFR
jgi:hypothetical protein